MKKRIIRDLNYDIAKVMQLWRGLTVIYNNEIPVGISGSFEIRDDADILQGKFNIHVVIPDTYPLGFPTLYETSGAIRRIADRHIGKNGLCCVEITHKIIQISRHGITILDFFNQYVHRFFCWQILYEIEPQSVLQWGHGKDGILEYYMELFRTSEVKTVKTLLLSFIENKRADKKTVCFCGSGKSFKKCHLRGFEELATLGEERIRQDIILFA